MPMASSQFPESMQLSTKTSKMIEELHTTLAAWAACLMPQDAFHSSNGCLRHRGRVREGGRPFQLRIIVDAGHWAVFPQPSTVHPDACTLTLSSDMNGGRDGLEFELVDLFWVLIVSGSPKLAQTRDLEEANSELPAALKCPSHGVMRGSVSSDCPRPCHRYQHAL